MRKNKTFRDHKVSLTSEETLKMIKDIKKIKLLGSDLKKPTIEEIQAVI